jgi:hypothetical protein
MSPPGSEVGASSSDLNSKFTAISLGTSWVERKGMGKFVAALTAVFVLLGAGSVPAQAQPAATEVSPAETLKDRLMDKVHEGDEVDKELVTEGWEYRGGGLMIDPVWFEYYHRRDGAYLVLANWALPRRPDAKHTPFRITDVLLIPPLQKGQEVAFDCRVKGIERKLAIIAVIQPDYENEGEWWKDVRQAWSISLDSGQIAAIDTDGVECVNERWGL